MRFSHQHGSWGRFNPLPCFVRSLLRSFLTSQGSARNGRTKSYDIGHKLFTFLSPALPISALATRGVGEEQIRRNAEGIDGVGSYELCQNELTACDWTQWNRRRHFSVCAA